VPARKVEEKGPCLVLKRGVIEACACWWALRNVNAAHPSYGVCKKKARKSFGCTTVTTAGHAQGC